MSTNVEAGRANRPDLMPDRDLEVRRAIVQRVIKYFGTQEDVAGQPEVAVDQSAVSLWHKRGDIPGRRQRQLIQASERLVREGKKDRPLEPWEFFRLPEGEAAVA